MSSSVTWVTWSADAAFSSTAIWTPGPWPSWLACTRGVRPFAMPGLEDRARLVAVEGAGLAEDVDPAGVGRAGVEHLALDQVDVGVGSYSGGTTCAPRKVVSGVRGVATCRLRCSSGTVRP